MATTKTNKPRLSSGDIFQHNGHTFKIEIEHDPGMGEPWKEHDGHGIVSDWTTRDKKPGERIMAQDRNHYRYYDIAETITIAIKDGWGVSPEQEKALAAKLGRKPTKRELTALAVEEDYVRMRGWCNDEWTWVSVLVTLLKEDEDAPNGYFETEHIASLCGIESDSEDYLSETGYELADEILFELNKTE